MIQRRGKMGTLVGAGAFLLATAIAGCAGLGGSHVDCNVVKLQSESGRSNEEIAAAIGASEEDVAKCPRASSGSSSEGGGPPNASEYGIPAGLEGGGSEGGASGGGAGGEAPPAPQP